MDVPTPYARWTEQENQRKLKDRVDRRYGSTWSSLTTRTKGIVIGFSVFAVLVVAGIVLAVVLTRKHGENISTTPTPSVSLTVTALPPAKIKNILLKDDNGDCYFFPSFSPVLGKPGECGNGYWVQNQTVDFLSYDASQYEFCIQRPTERATQVIGGTANCLGVVLEDNIIRAVKMNSSTEELCINETEGNILWDDCSTALHFTVHEL